MALPEAPNSRSEQYLAKIAGQSTTLPEAPNSRVEQYLDYIAENGTVSEEEIAEQVSDWLEENIHEDPTVVIDSSLSVSGAAADAKTVGDDIADIKTALTEQKQRYNIFPPSKYYSQIQRGNPATINGITYNVQSNGEVLATGTATAGSTYYLSGRPGSISGYDVGFTLPAGSYIFWLDEEEYTNVKVSARTLDESAWSMYFTKNRTVYTFDVDTTITIGIAIKTDTELPTNGLLIKPMIYRSDDKFYGYIAPWASITDYIPSLVESVDSIKMPLKDKKLSLLGDSISAYAGTIPEGNDAYYNGSRAGVTSPDQMWWKVLCEKTGMIPLIINGWSGSGINWQTESAHTDKVPMSDDSRCKGLHDSNTNPDIILIAGGLNDYSYAETAQNEPLQWDGKTIPGYTEPSVGKIVYNSFTEAYAAMIMKIQERYPDAVVVALSTFFTMRGTYTGCTYVHSAGDDVYTQQDYNDAIKFVAEKLHIPFVDMSNIGFNKNNFYPTYAEDSSTIPTHPNAAGQYVLGSVVAEKIVPLVKGYYN